MAEFSAQVYQNEFLPDGGTDVHAIVSITCAGAGTAGQGVGGDAAEIVIIDTSGSMDGEKIRAARQAAAAAIEQVLDGTWFAVIAGTERADKVFPYPNAVSPMVRMEPGARAAAQQAVSGLRAGGGTAIGSWLRLATQLLGAVPSLVQRHAILLTDGKNQSESVAALGAAVREAQEVFQCDCRGVGADWDVAELRGVATALLGTVDLIPKPEAMAESFATLMRQAMGRGVARAAGRPGPARRRRPGCRVRPGQGAVVGRRDAHHADQPGGRPLHRPGRARRGDPGGAGRQGRG